MKDEAGYYDWRVFEARLADGTMRYASKPGLPDWDRPDHAARLLCQAIDVGAGEGLIDLRCGTGIVAAVAGRRGAEVTVLDDSIVAVEAARRTLALNGVTPAAQRAGDYASAVLTLPKSREMARYLIGEAARSLKPGGRAYLAGANRSGVKSAIDDLEAMFGSAQVVAYGKGHRVASATQSGSASSADEDPFVELEIEACGEPWRIVTGPGVFAQGRLDDGTRRLIEAIRFRPGESLLDLGCGCGMIGLVAARMGNRVTCVDASAMAVEATRRTLSRAGIQDAEVIWSDCAAAVLDRQFDVVATNPPFHQGVGTDYAVARQFVLDAARVLRPGGRLALVANRFLRYEREMAGSFGQVSRLYEDGKYRVLEAVK